MDVHACLMPFLYIYMQKEFFSYAENQKKFKNLQFGDHNHRYRLQITYFILVKSLPYQADAFPFWHKQEHDWSAIRVSA